jgi:hypothetical protein
MAEESAATTRPVPGRSAVAGAEIERDRKPPPHIVEAVEEALGRLVMQEIDRTLPRRPVAMTPPGKPVEGQRRIGVRRIHLSRAARKG